MNILLDTHYVLWSLLDSKKLTQSERDCLVNVNNTIIVSTVSLWEISLKYQLKKLYLKNITPEDLPATINKSGFEIVDITSEEATTFYHLPRAEHSDPFDRMLIWQAIQHKWSFMTRDKKLFTYAHNGLQLLNL